MRRYFQLPWRTRQRIRADVDDALGIVEFDTMTHIDLSSKEFVVQELCFMANQMRNLAEPRDGETRAFSWPLAGAFRRT